MKKINYILTLLICLVCSFSFVGCGKDDNGNNTPPQKEYAITIETSNDYTLTTSKEKAEALEEITVSITINNIDKKLVNIKYGDNIISKNSNGNYSFIMPANDIKISAILEDYVETLATDNTSTPFMKYDSSNTHIVVPNTGTIELYVKANAYYMTILHTNITTSNPTAIPRNAIKVEGRITSSSNVLIGADIMIDTTKIQKGYSWIDIEFINRNTPSQRGKITFKLTVDDVIQVEKWTETLIFDISGLDEEYKNADFYVGLSDFDYVKGMDCKSYQYFENLKADNNKVTITMEYAVSHEYQVSFGIIDRENSANTIWFNAMDSIGEGNSNIGYNQCIRKRLSFVYNNSSLTIEVI